MRSVLKGLVKLGMLLGLAAAAARLYALYRGAPEGVGGEAPVAGEGDDPYAVDPATLGGDVSPDLIASLVCPLDKGPLELVDGQWLVNRRNGYRYPISDGIPVMLVEVGERYRDTSLIAATPAGPPAEA